jgi:hypothetical protein
MTGSSTGKSNVLIHEAKSLLSRAIWIATRDPVGPTLKLSHICIFYRGSGIARHDNKFSTLAQLSLQASTVLWLENINVDFY